jgi:perosamine synthetase
MMEQIPMSSPDITVAEIEAVNLVLQSRCLSAGPRIAELEDRFAAYACPEVPPELDEGPGRRVGTRHAIGVSSGTAGLHLCIIAAGIGECDLVVTTPFSFIASANCILYERAIPTFVDIDPATLNIDPTLVAEAVEALTNDQRLMTAGFPLPFVVRLSSFVGPRPSCLWMSLASQRTTIRSRK